MIFQYNTVAITQSRPVRTEVPGPGQNLIGQLDISLDRPDRNSQA